MDTQTKKGKKLRHGNLVHTHQGYSCGNEIENNSVIQAYLIGVSNAEKKRYETVVAKHQKKLIRKPKLL